MYSTRMMAFFVAATMLAMLVAGKVQSTCSPQRVAVAKLWVDKLNSTSNAQKLTEIMEGIVTDDFVFTIKGVGSFSPKNVAIEYSVLIYPFLGVYPFSTSIHTFDECAVYCDGDKVDLYHWGTSLFFPDSNGNYNTSISGLRLFQRLEFAPNTNLISKAFTANEKTYHTFFQSRPVNITQVCGWIQGQCVGGLQQYTSMQDCVDFMTQLSSYVTPCPFATVSNTLACRQLHALSSLVNPVVHCPHVAKVSPVCYDSCLTDCAGNSPSGFCAVNARCVDAYVDFTQEHYACSCNPGYTGDGHTSCTQHTCTTANNHNSWQCPGVYSYTNCTSGVCSCADSFTWNGQGSGSCGCAFNEQVQWTNGVPQCVPIGMCNERWQCPQSYNRVQCTPNPGNPFAKFKACACNYGFCGGRESQCSCDANKRVVWSNVHNGEICISATECTEDYHCGPNQHCNPGSPVGSCAL